MLNLNRSSLKISFSPSTDSSSCSQLEYLRCHTAGKLRFTPEHIYDFTSADLIDLGIIGSGNFGIVHRMLHYKSDITLAVKRIHCNTVVATEQKRLLMELEAIMNSHCENIVQFFGAIFREGDCWICMELMDLCSEKLYKIVYEVQNRQLPEVIIGSIAVSTLNALDYLKERLKIIHRDIKPSNILLDVKGFIKLCDFGIAGHLIDSIAKSQDAGCRPYMAPERLQSNDPYDVRSDVWSLGITLFEVSTGRFPFSVWNSPFHQLEEVVNGEPPIMHPDNYSAQLVNFVNHCLIKGKEERPKYKDLKTMELYKTYNVVTEEEKKVSRKNIGDFVSEALRSNQCDKMDEILSNFNMENDVLMRMNSTRDSEQTPRSSWINLS